MNKLILAGLISAIAIVPAAQAAQIVGTNAGQTSAAEFQRGERGWRPPQPTGMQDEQRGQRRADRRSNPNVGVAAPPKQQGDWRRGYVVDVIHNFFW